MDDDLEESLGLQAGSEPRPAVYGSKPPKSFSLSNPTNMVTILTNSIYLFVSHGVIYYVYIIIYIYNIHRIVDVYPHCNLCS